MVLDVGRPGNWARKATWRRVGEPCGNSHIRNLTGNLTRPSALFGVERVSYSSGFGLYRAAINGSTEHVDFKLKPLAAPGVELEIQKLSRGDLFLRCNFRSDEAVKVTWRIGGKYGWYKVLGKDSVQIRLDCGYSHWYYQFEGYGKELLPLFLSALIELIEVALLGRRETKRCFLCFSAFFVIVGS